MIAILPLTVAAIIGGAVAVSLINALVQAVMTPGPQSIVGRMHSQYTVYGWIALATFAFIAFANFVIAAKGGAM
jgi:large-conductance mechanosensitive channel